MRTPVKGIALMGNRYNYGGLCLTSKNELFVVTNGCNKLACYDLLADAIMWSANALGYAPFCEVQSICYLDAAAYHPSIVMLLKNGEVWRKDLVDFTEEKWGDPLSDFPECRGASGVEYKDNSLWVTFPQFNMIRKLALGTLAVVDQGYTGVPTQSPYPPAAISWDGVNGRFVVIDPVKGDLVYLTDTFSEVGRERYTYEIYNRCFDGDITWSRVPLPSEPGKDFFLACVDSLILQYGEPWYKLYEVDDLTGTAVEIEAIIMDNVEVGENVVKHMRLDNKTDLMRQAITISVTDDPKIMADDRTWLSATQVGPWDKTISLGDVSGHSVVDFFVRFHPEYGIDLGTFAVELVVDYTKLP